VCQVCKLYNPQKSGITISEVFEESRKNAEKKIKLEIESVENDEIVDLSIDEFEEEEEKIPSKFEKRKAAKASLDEADDFAGVECPFCGEIYDDLASHIRDCEFAPDDASLDDIMPSKPKKKRKKRATKKKPSGEESGEKKPQDKKSCPYCGKGFIRLGRHLKSCPKRPGDADEAKEAKFLSGEIDSL